MAEQKKNVPKRRFKEFENADAWEQRELGEVVEINSGRDYKHLKIGDIPVYGTGGYMTSVNIALSLETDAIGIGRKGTIDKPYYLKAPFWTVDTLFYAYSKDNYDIKFLNFLFKTINWKQHDESTGLPSLSKNTISKILVMLPKIVEQEKIGAFFQQLDDTITLHQRKLDKLKKQKEAYLSEMFPAEGQRKPKRRFAGFTDDWEQRELGEIVEINPATDIPETFEYIDLESVIGTEIINHRTENRRTAPSRAQRVAQKGDLFYQTVRPYQKNNVLFNIDRDDFVFSTGYAQLRWKYSGDFLLALVQNNQFVKNVLSRSTGTSYPAISPNELTQLRIQFPTSSKEINNIGLFFNNLDSTITLHQRKLDKLKKLKESYLNEMFT